MDIDLLVKQAADYEENEDYLSAEHEYDKILISEKTCPKIFAFRGYCRFCMGNYSGAIEDFNAALALKGNAASTLFYRAQAFEKIGRLENALSDYIASSEVSPETDVFLNISMILRYQGKESESEYYLKKALNLDPENEVIRNLLK